MLKNLKENEKGYNYGHSMDILSLPLLTYDDLFPGSRCPTAIWES